MNDLLEFKIKLFEKLKLYADPRPFVCDGNPLDCNIFIVGINPATKMEMNFENFWNEDGFDKQKWIEAYKNERANAPLKAGKKKRILVSPTRRSIDHILKHITIGKVLETNLYIKQTKEAHELKKKDKKTDIFEFLIQEIKPKIVVLHGKSVKDFFRKNYDDRLSDDDFTEININKFRSLAYATTHLSRGWSFEKLEELGKRIDNKIKEKV
jgi:hypothetical protein